MGAGHLRLPEFGPTQVAVIVGLVGVYLGFSTLSIQLHAGRAENEAAVAVPSIVRTHWLYFNWGIGLGVIVANFAALVLLDVGVPTTLHGISAANYLSVILLTCLIARFLYMTANDATLDMAGFVMRIAPGALADRVELARRSVGVRNAFEATHALPFRTSNRSDDIEIVVSINPGRWFVGIDESGVRDIISWLDFFKYDFSSKNASHGHTHVARADLATNVDIGRVFKDVTIPLIINLMNFKVIKLGEDHSGVLVLVGLCSMEVSDTLDLAGSMFESKAFGIGGMELGKVMELFDCGQKKPKSPTQSIVKPSRRGLLHINTDKIRVTCYGLSICFGT